MARHALKTKHRFIGTKIIFGIEMFLLSCSLILNFTIFNPDRVAKQFSNSEFSTNITKEINQKVSPLTFEQVKIPNSMVQSLVEDQIKVAYTTGNLKVQDSTIKPQVNQLITNLHVSSWFADKLSTQITPPISQSINKGIRTADNLKWAKIVHQAKIFNANLIWVMVAVNVVMVIYMIVTSKFNASLLVSLLICAGLLLMIGIFGTIGVNLIATHGETLSPLKQLVTSMTLMASMIAVAILLFTLVFFCVKSLLGMERNK